MKYVLFLISISFVLISTNVKANVFVADESTKLEWHFTSEYIWWESAIEYCNSLDGQWRLPNINELVTLIDYDAKNNSSDLSINPIITNAHDSGTYWSSTTRPGASDFAYVIFYDDGDTWSFPKADLIYKAHVACVRKG